MLCNLTNGYFCDMPVNATMLRSEMPAFRRAPGEHGKRGPSQWESAMTGLLHSSASPTGPLACHRAALAHVGNAAPGLAPELQ